MRINSHSHVFNLKSVFTPETMHILMNRLKIEKMPDSIMDILYEYLEGHLRHEISAEHIFQSLDERYQATNELREVFKKIDKNGSGVDLQIDGVISKLGDAASKYLRKKLMDMYDLDKSGKIKQDLFDYFDYLRIALLPSMEKVTDEIMSQTGDDDAIVALSMDITDGSDDGSLFASQLKAMSDAVLAYPGRVFPFVMVNPARDGFFDIMKTAINEKGFWGVKMYPSLGYPVFSEKLFPVYEYCIEKNVPILTHCTIEGFRKSKEYGIFASPARWVDVLEKYPDLKVCFGHFGADDVLASKTIPYTEWPSLIKESIPEGIWPAIIVNLMEKYPNVYADISFHTDGMIGINDIDKDTACKNYQNNINWLFNNTPCKNRLLFGTDFWLVRTVTKDSDYWSYYKEQFTSEQFDQLTQINPFEYLGMPGSAKPSEWLINSQIKYFKTKKLKVQRAPAAWLKTAAKSSIAPAEFIVTGSTPTWSRSSWISFILYEYLNGNKIYRKSDIDAKLTFEEYGRFKLANLTYWDQSPEPEIFETTVKGISVNIHNSYMVRYSDNVTYRDGSGMNEPAAIQKLCAALKNPDLYVYQLSELCDSIYQFDLTKG